MNNLFVEGIFGKEINDVMVEAAKEKAREIAIHEMDYRNVENVSVEITDNDLSEYTQFILGNHRTIQYDTQSIKYLDINSEKLIFNGTVEIKNSTVNIKGEVQNVPGITQSDICEAIAIEAYRSYPNFCNSNLTEIIKNVILISK
jgi:hypothetical protein